MEIPGYVRGDAALYYNHDVAPGNWLGAKQVNLTVNLRNLLDQRYTEAADGQPRTVLATVGIRFQMRSGGCRAYGQRPSFR